MSICECECIPVGDTSCYLPSPPTPSVLRFGTAAQTANPTTDGGGGGAVLVSQTGDGSGAGERTVYDMPADWGQLPGLTARVALHSRTSGVTKATMGGEFITMGGEGCGSAVVRFSRPLYVAFLPIIDFDNRREQLWGVSPPFLGRVRSYNQSQPFSGTNPSPTAGGFSFSIQDQPLFGGDQPNNCLPDALPRSPASRGYVFSTTNRATTENRQGALFFGYRRVSSVSWNFAVPGGLGIQFPWLAVVDQNPVRHARQHVCPQENGTSTTEWRDSVTGAVLTAAQLDTLDDCP